MGSASALSAAFPVERWFGAPGLWMRGSIAAANFPSRTSARCVWRVDTMQRSCFPVVVVRLCSVLGVSLVGRNAPAAETGRSSWVQPDGTGRLVYKTTPTGDRIMDFSHA